MKFWKDASGEPVVWTHWQNLNERRNGDVKGPGWRHGRAWMNVGHRTQFGCEWVLPSERFSVGIVVSEDSENTITVALCVPPASLFLSLESWPLGRWIGRMAKRYSLLTKDDWSWLNRGLSLRIFDWAVWWNLWRNPHHGRQNDPRQSSWHPFGHPGEQLGKAREVERREVKVTMPEKTYRAMATREVLVTRGTPRWPFARPWVSRVNLDFAPYGPVPVPGKGENSWDCGEDATYASSQGADTIEEAIADFQRSTARLRERRGGKNWRPAREVASA